MAPTAPRCAAFPALAGLPECGVHHGRVGGRRGQRKPGREHALGALARRPPLQAPRPRRALTPAKPVSRELVDSLAPDVIYLTHVHWDHFQGISLRKLGLDKRIVIPREPCGRMKEDLEVMGFRNVVELHHGQSHVIRPGFTIASYHFGPYLDSVLVIAADGH